MAVAADKSILILQKPQFSIHATYGMQEGKHSQNAQSKACFPSEENNTLFPW